MRRAFSSAVLDLAKSDERLILLTGDLGFGAFEEVARQLGERFINAGVAEQLMVGLAAGLAHRGFHVFCYSIAPFMVYRPLEQIRLDVCLHQLPVCFVGNGGGYGYGIMGATHHALEDLACMSALPHMECHIPANADGVAPAMEEILARSKPAYLRLGLGPIQGLERQPFGSVVPILQAAEARLTVVALGPIAYQAVPGAQERAIDLFSVVKIPFDESLQRILDSLRRTRRLIVLEEHVSRGGLVELLARHLLEAGVSLDRFVSRAARGYPGSLYGSQSYHQKQCGLDAASLTELFGSEID